MNKDEIIYKALDQFNQVGMQGEWLPQKNLIQMRTNNSKTDILVEVKKELREYQLRQLLELAKKQRPLVVVAETIFPKLKEVLRKNNIGYLDGAGNIYLNTLDHLVWIDGNKTIQGKKGISNKAFTKTGLKIIFYLLLDEEHINEPYRQIAHSTDAALGSIKNVVESLRESNFLLQVTSKKIKLQNKKALLERWITGYRESLKPSLHLGSYRFLNSEKFSDWQNLQLEEGETLWGGEGAGEKLTNHLKPIILTLYTNKNKISLINKLKLIPTAQNGSIEIYKKFWKAHPSDSTGFVPPLLVYADLLTQDDPRCIETAEIIYDKYLKDEFGNN